MQFKNRTIFFIPVWFDGFDSFCSKLDKSELWYATPEKELEVNYLLNYVSAIAKNKSFFRSFTLKEPQRLEICMFKEKLKLAELPEVERVRFSCFGTGVGFMEFYIRYPDCMTPLEIADFAYYFKKSTKARIKHRSLYEIACKLLPERSSATLFFTNSADFKKECLCYHMVCIGDNYGRREDMSDILYLLRRSYSRKFQSEHSDEDVDNGDYDMMYSVYSYDRWAGSQSGIVNVVSLTGDEDTDLFINTYKVIHLTNDYYFLYLLLLNQRFSAIQYIAQIATADDLKSKQLEELNKRIIKLKTTYSFNVVSDDQFFQNVYSKMYRILDIDRLLEDIRDNKDQMEILQAKNSERYEKNANKILFVISLLTLFSALVDAVDFFGHWPGLQLFSTYLGTFCVLVIVFGSLLWSFVRRNK